MTSGAARRADGDRIWTRVEIEGEQRSRHSLGASRAQSQYTYREPLV